MATLHVVSTPIGNLSDLAPRAAEALRAVRTVLAEDTRRTRVLTAHVGSSARLLSLHAHNEAERIDGVLRMLEAGEDVALVSDAGTPLVSDPGARLVRAVAGAGHRVVPIPGASAVLSALVGSGLPADRFTFLGFPDRKGPGRRRLLERVATAEEVVVLFESPQRLVALLDDLATACGHRREAAVARELTKVHEEFVRGTLPEVAAYYRENAPRGEVTVVVDRAEVEAGQEDRTSEARVLASELLAAGERPSEAARTLVETLDLARNDAYRIVQGLTKGTLDE